ncbi:uncharacterized protein Z520_09231 [Fonsecaea multimorphosa CBS 102226]|uniref:RRM domain-containing protein n=1 Tax=Fonsecaea multimorphosa CBS 102226 TaxID=1442371 RepID=A0A0D2ICU2_9EURO|nr:uncharacterized protein Z520_09231 [Fonsecaea multimorphosa CBS 102226]KIX94921.1 hypothetical protein Z520_09231 [Fonsecaea multimorphosa CBS 102226]OAL20572.1 hypothetical protein AYO22_08581 [Fonsecaea multimorphosa]
MDQSSKRRKLSSGSYEVVTSDADHPTQEPSPKSKEQRRSLFVRSLPASVTTERLTQYFSESFPLKHATVVLDPETKISRGFGFVTFADAEDAQAAVAQFNNSVLDGRKIKVELAEARHRDADIGAKSSVNTTALQLRAQREKNQAETQPPKLIVRNLPWSIKTAEDLSLLFRSYGKVKHAVVPKKGPKEQYGFGIVVLRGKKNAERALAGVNGKEVDGRTLAVDWAVDKKTWEELQHTRPETAQPAQDEPIADDHDEGDTRTDGDVDDGAESDNEAQDDDEVVADASDLVEDSEEESLEDLDAESDEEDIQSETESTTPGPEAGDNKNDTSVFVRNLPYTTDDDLLREHFSTFGPIRYARVVYDPETERSKGTGFVCFFNIDDAKACVKNAPKRDMPLEHTNNDNKKQREALKHSILENEAADPSGRYTLEGRVLQVSRALSREDAERRASEASEKRDARDRDKRRLYLLSEGSISKGSKLYEQLGKAEIDIRESSARQRQRLIKTNPNLCLSLTRLSVRNLPRGIGSKELKALAREAVVGFAKDVKAGLRQPLSKEELRRGGSEMQEAERRRKLSGKGIVKQAKVVFEDKEGSKVKEGAGRSRGYGFIEYVGHRNALAGLRWLNGHMVKPQNAGSERGKRLIVEFAIENAQVIQRRNEREQKAREGGGKRFKDNKQEKSENGGRVSKKRKRGDKDNDGSSSKTSKVPEALEPEEKNRVAKRNRIIAKKRQARKVRKG